MKLRVAIFIALLSSSLSAQVTYERLLRADREPQNWLTYSGGYAGHRYSSLVADQPEQREEPPVEVVLPSAVREEHEQPEQDGEHAARGGRRGLHRDRARSRRARRRHRASVLETLTPARSRRRTTTPTKSTRAWPSRETRSSGPRWIVTCSRSTPRPGASSGTSCWRTIARATSTTSRRSSSKTRSSWDLPRTKRAPTAGSRRTTSKPATNSGDSTPRPPQRMQPEAKTWVGDSWQHGGSPIWNAGSYDPETNLTFWGTGNPNPGLERRHPHACRQPVFQLRDRARCRHRKIEVVFPVHARRRVRLGRDPGSRARGHGIPGPAAKARCSGPTATASSTRSIG